MAEVIPFRGKVYNPEKIPNPGEVTTPPYDVISPEEQALAYARHPHNIIRLILGKESTEDSEANNRYTRAARYWKEWTAESILIRDPQPAFYLTATRFTVEDRPLTRFGLIARVRLEPFNRGVILPHETTFSGIKSDRLRLMQACHANFSPIFSLYPDPDRHLLTTLKDRVQDRNPDMDFTDTAGDRQRLWRITDGPFCEQATRNFQDKTLYIADGHHRYETALAYRDWLAQVDPDFSDDHPANFIMMYLTGITDPGLVVLPAHRMVRSVPADLRGDFIAESQAFFDIFAMPFRGDTPDEILPEFLSELEKGADRNTIGVFMKGRTELLLLRLREGVMDRFADELPESLRTLDVTVLTRLLLMEVLGFDGDRLDDPAAISYTSRADTAMEAVFEGGFDMAFLLNPTRIEQVRKIAREGLIMPRKSTYFYPKVITGQVINPLTPGPTD
jgi:uncharacterized protein (DUF1015 family)